MDDGVPEVRIGDRERQAVDRHLRQALDDGVLTLLEYDERSGLCWAARTRTELDVLVRDLPTHRATPAPLPAAPARQPRRVHPVTVGVAVGAAVALAAVGYFGVQVATAEDGFAAFGSQVVSVSPGQGQVEVGVAFGSVEVVVPDGVRTRINGTVVFGSTSCETACRGAGSELVVDVTGGFGSVSVKTAAENADRDD